MKKLSTVCVDNVTKIEVIISCGIDFQLTVNFIKVFCVTTIRISKL